MLTTDESPTLFDCVNLYGHEWEAALSDYPIFDESKREWLNTRIYEHFEYREIGQETATDHFRLIRRTMHEMMPALNPMFDALNRDFDILEGYQSTNVNDTSTTEDSKSLYSATPQTQLSGAENYATNMTENTGANTQKNTATSTGRGAPIGDMLTSWASSINNALYLVYNGLEPYYQQIFD